MEEKISSKKRISLKSILNGKRFHNSPLKKLKLPVFSKVAWHLKFKNFSLGFTLVELLVVMSMVGVLASFLLIFINPVKQLQKAKDARRQADLSQIRGALDVYYNDNNCYPTSITFGSALQSNSTIYIQKIPQDPDCSTGGSCYQYLTDTSSCPQWISLYSKALPTSNAVACPLQQYPGNCLPSNYNQTGYGTCVVSGTVNCAVLASLTLPTSGGSQVIPTVTPSGGGGGGGNPTSTPTTAPTSGPSATPTHAPTATLTPTRTPTPTIAPTNTNTPTPTSTGLKTVTVSSVPALLTALKDNTVDVIIVTNGTYQVTEADNGGPNALTIGSQYASRTRPITVKAQTDGGVTFDGGGTGYFGGLLFYQGAHDQTWRGFNFTHGDATQTGVIVFGSLGSYTAPYNITLQNISIYGVTGPSVAGSTANATAHAVYFSDATGGGPHNITIDGLYADGLGGLSSILHFYHSNKSKGLYNAHDVVIKNFHAVNFAQSIILWDSTLKNITFQNGLIEYSNPYAVRFETVGATNILFSNVVSTGSGKLGFYSSLGTSPSGLIFDSSTFLN